MTGFTLTKSYAVHMDVCREELGHIWLKGFRPLGEGKETAASSPAADMASTPFILVLNNALENCRRHTENQDFNWNRQRNNENELRHLQSRIEQTGK